MARQKEFDRTTALKAAIGVFADRGYGGTSTEDLLAAMGIGRQSMYDTFGDKRRLYMEAYRHYSAESVSGLIRTMSIQASALAGLEEAMCAFSDAPQISHPRACMGVSAICEFGRSDDDIAGVTDLMGKTLNAGIERLILEGKAKNEIAQDIDAQTAALFISTVLAGMKVSARAGASSETLRRIARLAVRSLK